MVLMFDELQRRMCHVADIALVATQIRAKLSTSEQYVSQLLRKARNRLRSGHAHTVLACL